MLQVMAQRTASGAAGISLDIAAFSVGGSKAHRTAASEGRVISFTDCRSALFPDNSIIIRHATGARTCIGAIYFRFLSTMLRTSCRGLILFKISVKLLLHVL